MIISLGPVKNAFFTKGTFEDRPHILHGVVTVDGTPIRGRVEVRDRRTGTYVASTVCDPEGIYLFTKLPPQTLSNPYILTRFDDRSGSFDNAMVFDRVYQVDSTGNPPQT